MNGCPCQVGDLPTKGKTWRRPAPSPHKMVENSRERRKIRNGTMIDDTRCYDRLWEDMQDTLIGNSRRNERSIPLEKVKASFTRRGRLSGSLCHSFQASAEKEIEPLENRLLRRIFLESKVRPENPSPGVCKKLKSTPDLWRIRSLRPILVAA